MRVGSSFGGLKAEMSSVTNKLFGGVFWAGVFCICTMVVQAPAVAYPGNIITLITRVILWTLNGNNEVVYMGNGQTS